MIHAYIVFAILIISLGLFIWGYWRYDIVALIALVLGLISGVIPIDKAFSGFSNSAVITVVSVMILSQAISDSGLIDYVVKKFNSIAKNTTMHIASLGVMSGILSAFMNNVGALALMMPVAIRTAIDNKRSPSLVLMPLAFASVLGGLITAIGTPPNLLVSAYRQQITGTAFSLFSFTPVGIIVAIVGILFITFIGWRLLPKRKAPSHSEDLFHMEDYIAEIQVPEDSKLMDEPILSIEELIEGGDYAIIGFIRKKRRHLRIDKDDLIQAKDVLIIEASHKDLEKLLAKSKFQLIGDDLKTTTELRSDSIGLMEAVVPQGSRVEQRSSKSMRLRSRFNLNLLAIARQGKPFRERLHHEKMRAGDVVLLQGDADTLQENVVGLGMLPLVERGVKVSLSRRAWVPLAIFLGAVLLAGFRIFPIQVAFVIAVLAMVLAGAIPVRKLYDSIDWSIIVLLACMIPVGEALQSTGGTQLIAQGILSLHSHLPIVMIMALIFIITMTLSDVMNNAATAVIMAPIAASIAQSLHVNIDPFLMTVAVSASCSFLTPISHQNNTLVMGPGGYRFFDYFRMGLLLELIVLVVAIPSILYFWPL